MMMTTLWSIIATEVICDGPFNVSALDNYGEGVMASPFKAGDKVAHQFRPFQPLEVGQAECEGTMILIKGQEDLGWQWWTKFKFFAPLTRASVTPTIEGGE
jgi:hypothetical protein